MRHHIIVKWNSSVTDKAALLAEVEELFGKTTSIPGIHKVEMIPNIIDRPNRYDLMIAITMEESALPVYDESVYHKEWKEKYGKYLETKAIFDSADFA